jgi:hypothetical protein
VRWRRIDLQKVIKDRFGIEYHERSVSRLLHELGFSHVSARPRPPGQNANALEDFKKEFPARVAEIVKAVPEETPIEIWFQDEMRVGQKNGLVRQWARQGTRPRQPKDQRSYSAYLFGAVAPELGKGAAVVMPAANTRAVQEHLNAISRLIASSAHAIVVLDRAGWHTTDKLAVPENLSLLPLPPQAPELNPEETIGQYLRQTHLSNRVFDGCNAIVDACCNAWNRLIDQPERIRSIATRTWATAGQTQ